MLLIPRFPDVGLLVLRVSFASGMFFLHGLPKLMNYSQSALAFPDPLGIGSQASLILTIFAEVFCSVALALGLFARISAFVLALTMAVAAFIVHATNPLAQKELALVYGIAFLVLALTGPGRLSLKI